MFQGDKIAPEGKLFIPLIPIIILPFVWVYKEKSSGGVLFAVDFFLRAAAPVRLFFHPAQGHPQTGQQLVHTERLGEVIVRPCIQGFHLVPVLAAGRNHQDGHLAPSPDLADDLHPIHIGQAQVQQQHIGPAGCRLQQRLGPIGRSAVLVALGLQGSDDQIADGLIVLHHQNTGRFFKQAQGRPPPFSSA